MAVMTSQTIHLHRKAPAKPNLGATCNGCGVCCLVETCPAGLILFRQKRGPCPALRWNEPETRYDCGFVTVPQQYLRGLPAIFVTPTQALFRRWIASGKGCDCSFTLDD